MSAIHEQTFHLSRGSKLIVFEGMSVKGSPFLYQQGHRLIVKSDLFSQFAKNSLLVEIEF